MVQGAAAHGKTTLSEAAHNKHKLKKKIYVLRFCILNINRYFFQKHVLCAANRFEEKKNVCRQLRAFKFKTIEIQGWKFRTIFACVPRVAGVGCTTVQI
jgi:hypothetical protein